ncbi:MAG: PDZ domain-containing protein [Verrucomicrobiales bacterium]|nr:PDZ domain-containing protein [Verrucomicrobiales bacterium]
MKTTPHSILLRLLVAVIIFPAISFAEPDKSAEKKENKVEKKERPRKVALGEQKKREAKPHVPHARPEAGERVAPKGPSRTFLGVATSPVAPSLHEHLELEEGFGIQIHEALPDSPAVEAGLRRHDILVKFEDQMLISPEHLSLLVRTKKSGDKVDLTLIRKGAEKVVTVTLGGKEEKFFAPQGHHRMMPGQRGYSIPGLNPHDSEKWREHMKEQQDQLRKNWFQMKDEDFSKEGVKSPNPKDLKVDGRPPAVSVQPGFPVTVLGSKGILKIDNQEGEVTITEKDGEHRIEIRDAKENLIHEGDFDPKAGTEALPEEAQKYLEKMKLDNLEVLTPQSAPEVKKTNAPAREKAGEELL